MIETALGARRGCRGAFAFVRPGPTDGRTDGAPAWIVEEDWSEQRSWLASCIGTAMDELTVRNAPNEELALAAVREGFGLYLASSALAQQDLISGRLVEVFDPCDNRPGSCIVQPKGPRRAVALRFIRWLKTIT